MSYWKRIEVVSQGNPVDTLRASLEKHGVTTAHPHGGNPTPGANKSWGRLVGKTNIYYVIRDVLHTHGASGRGLSGGGIEHYPLKNGWWFGIAWRDDGSALYYLGPRSKAF